MDLHHLRAFIAVAEELHFGRAALRLHIAQPPLSRTIQQLERQLGHQLFDRTTRRVTLTTQGEALLEPAREVLRAVEQAERAVAFAGEGEIGHVHIGFAGPSSHELIGMLARAVRARHPGIELSLTSMTYGQEAARRVLDGSLDMALVRLSSVPTGLSARVIQKERLVVAAPEDHWLSDRDHVGMAELAAENWVTLAGWTSSIVRQRLFDEAEAAGFVPRIAQQAPDSWTIFTLVEAGVGITLTLDTAVASTATEHIRVVTVEAQQAWTQVDLVWRTSDRSPALHRVIRQARRLFPGGFLGEGRAAGEPTPEP